MKLIALTQGKTVQVSDEDYAWLMQWKWYAVRKGRTWYAQRTDYSGPVKVTIRMHRLVFERAVERSLGLREEPDHQDCDGLNNQRENLRLATRQQQCGNRTRPQTNSSGSKGVCFKSDRFRRKPWFAQIEVNGKNSHLGYFATRDEAAAAYDAAAIEHFGDFALTNGRS